MPLEPTTGLAAFSIPEEVKKRSFAGRRRRRKPRDIKRSILQKLTRGRGRSKKKVR